MSFGKTHAQIAAVIQGGMKFIKIKITNLNFTIHSVVSSSLEHNWGKGLHSSATHVVTLQVVRHFCSFNAFLTCVLKIRKSI